MVTSRRSFAFAAALSGVVAFALAACSSSGSSDSGGTTSSTTPTSSGSTSASTPSGTPIKIGFAVAKTGVSGPTYAAGVPAAQAWAKWVNANGGINNHPVDVVIEDTQSTPTAGTAAVHKLVEQDNVSAIMVSDNGVEGSVASYLVGKNIAVIGANGFDPSVWGQTKNFFPTTAVPTSITPGVVIAAKALGLTTVGTMACAEVPACAAVEGILKPKLAQLGMKSAGLVTVSASAANYTAECLSMIQKNADMIFAAVTPQTTVRVAQDCLQQGFNGYFGISTSAFDPVALNQVNGLKVVGDLTAFPWWADAPPVQQYRDAMAQYAPGARIDLGGATGTWVALELFRKAVSAQTSGDVTRQSVLDDYNQVKDETLGGLLPAPVTFTAGKPGPLVQAVWLIKFNSGDKNPTILPSPDGKSCNGASGVLASACATPGP